jgi:hypothetical protein
MNCRHCGEKINQVRGQWLATALFPLPRSACRTSPIALHYPVDARSILRDLVGVLFH